MLQHIDRTPHRGHRAPRLLLGLLGLALCLSVLWGIMGHGLPNYPRETLYRLIIRPGIWVGVGCCLSFLQFPARDRSQLRWLPLLAGLALALGYFLCCASFFLSLGLPLPARWGVLLMKSLQCPYIHSISGLLIGLGIR